MLHGSNIKPVGKSLLSVETKCFDQTAKGRRAMKAQRGIKKEAKYHSWYDHLYTSNYYSADFQTFEAWGPMAMTADSGAFYHMIHIKSLVPVEQDGIETSTKVPEFTGWVLRLFCKQREHCYVGNCLFFMTIFGIVHLLCILWLLNCCKSEL